MAQSFLYREDTKKLIKTFEANTFDSIVTDPPYGIKFMGKAWDYDIPSVEVFEEFLRVLKPGGHILCFCGTRTQHRMAVNIEDAGFEIRDVVSWLYGQGFPKSLDIGKAIKATLETGGSSPQNLRKNRMGTRYSPTGQVDYRRGRMFAQLDNDDSKVEVDNQWAGWKTCLKPACELITLARKPISEKTVALNVLKWGTGALNIGDTLIELDGEVIPINVLESWTGFGQKERPAYEAKSNTEGRYPSNVMLDEEAAALLEEQQRGASRFFYCSKASKKEKNIGIATDEKNYHPTVKPVDLMGQLCKLITPLNGKVLDPFMGSGSTGVAAIRNNFDFYGIERDSGYFNIATARINKELE